MPTSPNVILRERLIAAVDARWQGGLGLILGGAGLGKSTLVRQAMLESATLGRGTEQLVRCRQDWTAAGVHQAIRHSLAIHDEAASTDGNPEPVLERLWSMAPQRVGLVLDDVHLLHESGIDYVLELRDLLPSNAHILIASRESALLTALLMTANPLFVIDSDDLLFTSAEVDDFATESNVSRLVLQSAGGWPAVLALTASAGHDVAGTYLYQKVLAGLSRRQQGDLAVAAALGEVGSAVALDVFEGPVRDLASIPLVETPASGGIIVHDLWREPLGGLVPIERLSAARKVAASHAEAERDVDQAVSLLVEGDMFSEARNVILRYVALGADRVPVDRVDHWLRVFTAPGQELLRELLMLLRAGLEGESLSDHELDGITERCRQSGEFDLEAVVCEIRFAAAWSADETDACIAIAERLAELYEQGVEAAAPGSFLRDVTIARRDGNNAEVLALIVEARDRLPTTVGTDWHPTLELEMLVSLGRPFEALDVLRAREERFADRKIRSVTYALTYWFAGQADEALRSLEAILREPGRFEGLERSWRATSSLFRAYRCLGVAECSPTVRDENEWFSLYSRVCEGLAQVAHEIQNGNEASAASQIEELKQRLPPTSGIVLQAWFMGVAMWYVLVPEDRKLLDSFLVEELHGEAGAVLKSFVVGRETGESPADLIERWPTPAQVTILLPQRWVVELALRLPESRADHRQRILRRLEKEGRPALQALAAGSDAELARRASAVLAARPKSPDHVVSVQLFGSSALQVPGHDEAPDWRRRKVRALLGFLATRSRASREQAIDALWPDLDTQAGRRNLRVTLSYLTRALEPDRDKSAPPWFVQSDGESLSLHRVGLDLDIFRLTDGLSEALQHRANGLASRSIDVLRSGVAAYQGLFLEDLDEPWILVERANFQRQATDACLRLVALLQAGRSVEASQWARRAIEIDPYSIDAHELLVETLQGGPPHEVDAARARLVELLDS